MPWSRAPLTLSLAALLVLPALVAGARRPDLDVSIPPGAATDWGRAFPAFTPSRGSLFATSPRPVVGGPDAPDRSSSKPRKAELDVHIGSSFGLVRILTWDLQAHLSWISGQHDLEPLSGRSGREPALPRPGDALYWIGIAPLLRLMLHPELVSQAGTLAHLIEIGEPVLGVLSSVEREGQLRNAARLLEEEILARRDSVAPLAGETPLDRMWSRFVFEELVGAHPYDPQDDFGAQLFAFGDELLPYVLRYASSEDPFLRRNAVAALSRYRQRDAYLALVEHALTGEDPVVLARALAGLGRGFGSAVGSALAERSSPRDEPWLQVAMIAALGRMGASDAAPMLIERGERARRDDTDVLIAVLEALARMRRHDERLLVVNFAEQIHRQARSRPDSFDHGRKNPTEAPDRADPQGGRGLLIAQLALCLRVSLDPMDEELTQELLGLISATSGGRGRFAPRGLPQSLQRVYPRAQPLVLEMLARIGSAGDEALLSIAADGTLEPSTRGLALSLAPSGERGELAKEMIEEDVEDEEMLIQALEVLRADNHADLVELCTLRVRRGGQMPPTRPRAVQRHLAMRALQILDERDALSLTIMQPILDLLDTAEAARSDEVEQLRELVRQVVDAHATRTYARTRRGLVDSLIELALELQLTPMLDGVTPSSLQDQLEANLRALNNSRDSLVQANVRVALMQLLAGSGAQTGMTSNAQFEPPVQLEEEICLALGRVRSPEATLVLLELLQNRDHDFRAWACLGLGLAGEAEHASSLVSYLMDERPFVRLCAWRSLKHLTGQDFFVDWLYGERLEISRAAEKYFAWIARNG